LAALLATGCEQPRTKGPETDEARERRFQRPPVDTQQLLWGENKVLDPEVPEPETVPGAPAPPPSWEGAPFATELPPFPVYRIPTEEDCHWIIEGGVARSTQGLATISCDKEGAVVGHCYRASIARGHSLPIIIGVHDDAGPVAVGGLYNADGGRSVTVREKDGGWRPLKIELVGLSDHAEVRLGWTGKWGYPAHVGAYHIGLRGDDDSFIIRANEPAGTVILDGCWFLTSKRFPEPDARHASGMHLDEWETLVWRRHQWRGATPDAPGALFREHVGYLKSSRGVTWILENNLLGGNRTGFQIRPGADDEGNPVPVGPVVIAHNYADGYGWTHGSDGATREGGSCITVWSSPNAPVFLFRNRITDARYGCLMVGAQGVERNWLNEAGFPIQAVYIAGNVFENARGDRETVSISGVEHVRIWADNQVAPGSRWLLDNRWAVQTHGIRNGSVELFGGAMPRVSFYTFDGTDERPLTPAELAPMRK